MPPHRNAAQATPETDAGGSAAIYRALDQICGGLFVLTAAYEDRQAGGLVQRVQRCCDRPPMVSVPIPKGHPIMPLISESHRFGLAQLGDDDRTTRRRFASDSYGGDGRFLGIPLVSSQNQKSSLPIPRTSVGYLECELGFHVDVEGDHDLFIGRVIAGEAFGGDAAVTSGADHPADEVHTG